MSKGLSKKDAEIEELKSINQHHKEMFLKANYENANLREALKLAREALEKINKHSHGDGVVYSRLALAQIKEVLGEK